MKIKHIPIYRSFVRGLYSAVRFILRPNPKQLGFVSSPDLSDSRFALFESVLQLVGSQKFRLIWLVYKPVCRLKLKSRTAISEQRLRKCAYR